MKKKPVDDELEREVLSLRKTVSKNDYMERVYHAIANSIMILDKDQNILSVNRATERITGIETENLKGKKCYQVFHDSNTSPAACPLQKMLNTGEVETMEMEIESRSRIRFRCFEMQAVWN